MAQRRIHDTPSTRVMAYRKRRMEEMKRVEIWLQDDELAQLDAMVAETGISRARVVAQLLLERARHPIPHATASLDAPIMLDAPVAPPPPPEPTPEAKETSQESAPPVLVQSHAPVAPVALPPPPEPIPEVEKISQESAPPAIVQSPVLPNHLPAMPRARSHIQRGHQVFLASLLSLKNRSGDS